MSYCSIAIAEYYFILREWINIHTVMHKKVLLLTPPGMMCIWQMCAMIGHIIISMGLALALNLALALALAWPLP